MAEMANRDAEQPQERDDFDKTIERSDPNEVGRAGPPLQKRAEGENAGDHSDTRVVQPGEEPPPEADRP
jgi:hypothetical protein